MKPAPPTSATRWISLLACCMGSLALLCFGWWQGLFLPQIDRLTRQLQSAKRPQDRGQAAKLLGGLGAKQADRTAPALIAALRDDGRYLTNSGAIVPNEHPVRIDAYNALRRIRSKATVAALTNALAEKARQVKAGRATWDEADAAVARLLGEMGVERSLAAEAIVAALEDCNDGEVAKGLVLVLAKVRLVPDSPAAKRAKEVLPKYCFHTDGTGRTAAGVLYQLSPDDAATRKLYVQAMLSGDPPPPPGWIEMNRLTLPLVIEHLGGTLSQAASQELIFSEFAGIPAALGQALHDGDPKRRAAAARTVAGLTNSGAELHDDLTALLGDDHPEVRVAGAIALWQVMDSAKPSVPVLLAAAASEDAEVRAAASGFLRERGPRDVWAAAELAAYGASENDKAGRIVALETLARIGPAASESLPKLRELLRADDEAIQRAAARAVAAIEKP